MLGSICIIEFINTKQIARIRKFKNNDQKKTKKSKRIRKDEENT
jgi:hypothetical protein